MYIYIYILLCLHMYYTYVYHIIMYIYIYIYVFIAKPSRRPRPPARGFCSHTAIFHTKNCRTKNLWVKIPKSLR